MEEKEVIIPFLLWDLGDLVNNFLIPLSPGNLSIMDLSSSLVLVRPDEENADSSLRVIDNF